VFVTVDLLLHDTQVVADHDELVKVRLEGELLGLDLVGARDQQQLSRGPRAPDVIVPERPRPAERLGEQRLQGLGGERSEACGERRRADPRRLTPRGGRARPAHRCVRRRHVGPADTRIGAAGPHRISEDSHDLLQSTLTEATVVALACHLEETTTSTGLVHGPS
jgi:hypothetical protein